MPSTNSSRRRKITDKVRPTAAMKAPTRTAILNAARWCFISKGIHETSVDDILRSSKISRATLYRHFTSLQEVAIEVTVSEVRTILEKTVDDVRAQSFSSRKMLVVLVTTLCRSSANPFLGYIESIDKAAVSRVRYILADPKSVHVLIEPLVGLLAQGSRPAAFRADLSTEWMAEWLLRNVWSLRLVPPATCSSDGMSLEDYVDRLVVQPLLTEDQTLMADSLRLRRIEEALERVELLIQR